MDSNGQAIRVTGEQDEKVDVGVYDFINYQGMLAVGDEYYVPVAKNGQPFLNEDATVMKGYIEKSNASFENEIVKVIEAQRAYQAQLRMITTADQIEQTINNLR